MSQKDDSMDTMKMLISALKTLISEVAELKPINSHDTPGMIMGNAMIQGMEEWAKGQKK